MYLICNVLFHNFKLLKIFKGNTKDVQQEKLLGQIVNKEKIFYHRP